MTALFLQLARNILFLLACAGIFGSAGWGRGIASSDADCTALKDRSPSLVEAENFVRAELFVSAECSARRLTEAQPDSADAHFLLGYILNRRDKADESLKEYTVAASFRRPSTNDLAIVALDYALLKDYPDAEKWMTEALKSDSKNALYWYYLGRIRYALNSFDKSRVAFDQALRLAPHGTRSLYNLGLVYEGLGETDQAVLYYKQAIASEQGLTPQDAQPYYDLGSLLSRREENEKALPLLQQAANLEPRNPAFHEQLARAEEQTGQLAASRKDLELAVALAPGVGSLHFELGRIYQKLHMSNEAKQQFDLCKTMMSSGSSATSDNLDFTRAQ